MNKVLLIPKDLLKLFKCYEANIAEQRPLVIKLHSHYESDLLLRWLAYKGYSYQELRDQKRITIYIGGIKFSKFDYIEYQEPLLTKLLNVNKIYVNPSILNTKLKVFFDFLKNKYTFNNFCSFSSLQSYKFTLKDFKSYMKIDTLSALIYLESNCYIKINEKHQILNGKIVLDPTSTFTLTNKFFLELMKTDHNANGFKLFYKSLYSEIFSISPDKYSTFKPEITHVKAA